MDLFFLEKADNMTLHSFLGHYPYKGLCKSYKKWQWTPWGHEWLPGSLTPGRSTHRSMIITRRLIRQGIILQGVIHYYFLIFVSTSFAVSSLFYFFLFLTSFFSLVIFIFSCVVFITVVLSFFLTFFVMKKPLLFITTNMWIITFVYKKVTNWAKKLT